MRTASGGLRKTFFILMHQFQYLLHFISLLNLYIQMLKFGLRVARYSGIKEKITQERLERLKNMPTNTQEKLRNFGIIAHIDAGKTTTTERMLYYAGAIPFPGEVHDGTTTMDFLPQERQRGITIRSAAISFSWQGLQYNLIDTPGHIDFTAEVERSLRVLDGAIAIFDGVSGVQTQSETVWLQANKFQIPRIAFINKLDRQGANLDFTLQSMEQRLRVKPLIIQIPVGETDHFNSVIDLITMEEIRWLDKYGTEIATTKIDASHAYYKKAIAARDQLLSNLSEFDEKIAELYLEDSQELLNQQLLYQAIRSATLNNPLKTCPVYVGSALRNRGIQPVLTAVSQFLPGPTERPPIIDINNPKNKRKLEKSERLCAYVYKIIQDNEFGTLAFARIYSGTMTAKSGYMNSTKDEVVRVQNLLRVRANRYVNINEVSAGDIVALQAKGLQAGSTLVNMNDEKFVLQQLQLPQSVFFAGLEYESSKDKQKLDQALNTLQLEDDSLRVTQEEGSQILIGGQGELHLEIVVQRLKEDFGLNTKLLKMQVEYKESISSSAQKRVSYVDSIKGRPLYFELEIKLEPVNLQTNEIVLDFPRDSEFDLIYKEYKEKMAKKDSKDQSFKYLKNPCKQIEMQVIEDENGEEDRVLNLASLPFNLFYHLEQTLLAALNRGFLKSYPMFGVRASILEGGWSTKRTTELVIGRCIQKLITEIGSQVKPIIMEPFMAIEISCPRSVSQRLMNDFVSHRRGKIEEMGEENSRFGEASSGRIQIKGQIPLQETIGYATAIRSMSQGEAYFVMQFKDYEHVGGSKQQELIEKAF